MKLLAVEFDGIYLKQTDLTISREHYSYYGLGSDTNFQYTRLGVS